MFCLEHLVLFASLLVSLPQSSLLYTPFERAIHELEFDRVLYVLHISFELDSFAHSASLISFERDNFCSSTSFISFRARWWICFKETI